MGHIHTKWGRMAHAEYKCGGTILLTIYEVRRSGLKGPHSPSVTHIITQNWRGSEILWLDWGDEPMSFDQALHILDSIPT